MTATAARASRWAEESVISPETTPPEQMAKVFGHLKGLHATYLINLGVRLGLFELLAERPEGLASDALAAELGLNARYTRLWCETACALELLDYDPAAGYRLAPGVEAVLGRPGGAAYVGEFPAAHLQVARDYERYERAFRSGETHPYGDHDEPFLRSVAEATRVLPRMFIDAVLPQLPDLNAALREGVDILDVGCGAGHALVELASTFELSRCVGLDVDPVSVGMAERLIEVRPDLGGRVAARVADGAALPDDLAGQFDLVTMFLVLHEVDPAAKLDLLRECHRALRPGGKLMLFDERYPDGPSELRDPTQIFAVMAQWYEAVWGNILDDRATIRANLEDAGFGVEHEVGLSRFYIVTATRAN